MAHTTNIHLLAAFLFSAGTLADKCRLYQERIEHVRRALEPQSRFE